MSKPGTVRVTHLIDSETPEDAARLTSLLLASCPRDQVNQQVICIGPRPASLNIPATIHVSRASSGGVPLLALPMLRRLSLDSTPDVLHAPSAQTFALAGMLRRIGIGIPVVATFADPAEAKRVSRWWASLSAGIGGVELLCTSQLNQRRAVEAGVPLSATAVVRPGVDFGELRAARQNASREAIGLNAEHRVLVMPSPPSRAGGQFFGVWATAILHQLWPQLKLIIPGISRESRRIARLLRQIYCPSAFVMTGNQYSPAQLVAIADALLVPAVEDISTGWLGVAMAAGVPVIGSAIPCVTEYIADRNNGFLCRAGEPHTLAIRIRTAFESPELMRQCVEVARGQAYDVFRAQQCIEQYTSAFITAAQGRSIVSAVRDAALVK